MPPKNPKDFWDPPIRLRARLGFPEPLRKFKEFAKRDGFGPTIGGLSTDFYFMSVDSQELDNMVKWDGRQRPCYEVYYLKLNLLPSEQAWWIRYTLLAPKKDLGPPSASVWALRLDGTDPRRHIAVKETVTVEQATIDRDIFFFQAGESSIYNNGARGRVVSGGHELRWDLQFIPNERTHRLFPVSFYHLPFPSTKFLSPNWSVRVSGELEVDGERQRVEAVPGCQAHLWGPRHAERWAWAHCNTFREDPEAVFEALTGQLRVGKKARRPLTAFSLRFGDGRVFNFNRISQLLFNESRYSLEAWELGGRRGHYRLKASIQNRPAEMVGVTDTDPDGSKLYCYHAETADFRVELFEQGRGKDRLLQTLTSSRAGAFEVVGRAPEPGMALHL